MELENERDAPSKTLERLQTKCIERQSNRLEIRPHENSGGYVWIVDKCYLYMPVSLNLLSVPNI